MIVSTFSVRVQIKQTLSFMWGSKRLHDVCKLTNNGRCDCLEFLCVCVQCSFRGVCMFMFELLADCSRLLPDMRLIT